MSDCDHDMGEREAACADGYCPLCLGADNKHLREILSLRNQTACDRKEIIAKLEAEIERLEIEIEHLQRRQVRSL